MNFYIFKAIKDTVFGKNRESIQHIEKEHQKKCRKQAASRQTKATQRKSTSD